MDAKVYGDVMAKYWRYARGLHGTAAKTPEEFFGFTCNDVENVYVHKQGAGEGMWFRLKDGRVFDAQARPDEPDAAFYDATTH
jgi:hypothetical protein